MDTVKPLFDESYSSEKYRLKRFFDACTAAIALVILIPLFLVIAIGVKLSSPGPVIYSQARVGRGGKCFEFLKFRSMALDADAILHAHLASNESARQQWSEYQKLKDDPRITRFGRFIRRTSLDELPQLWNVLIGQMSIVGPRPCLPAQRSYYADTWRHYCSVRPGLTGLWQVNGRNKLTFEERVRLDRQYVESQSLKLDLKIVWRTVAVVLTGEGSA